MRLIDLAAGGPASPGPLRREGLLDKLGTNRSGRPIRGNLPATRAGSAASSSVGGDTLASAGADGEVRVWELPGGRERHRLRGHAGAIRALAVSGQRLGERADGTLARQGPRVRQAALVVACSRRGPSGRRHRPLGRAHRGRGWWRRSRCGRSPMESCASQSPIPRQRRDARFSPDGALLALAGCPDGGTPGSGIWVVLSC